MNILITGASGFIGQNLVKNLLSSNHNIITLDLKPKVYNTKHYCLDITDLEQLLSIEENIDIIYHLAAQSYGKGSLIDPEKDLNWNAKGTLNICRFAKLKQVKKIIYSSSMAIYGNNKVSIETDTPSPLSNYGISKLTGEYYIKNLNIPYTIFRLYNTYGSGQDLSNDSKGVVLAFTKQIVKEETPIKVTGPLDRFRDIIHIDDVIEGLKLGLQQNTNNEIYNLSTNIKTTIKQLIESIIKASGKSNIEFYNVGSLEGDQFGNTGCNKKLIQLGWKPTVLLGDGIQGFYKYVKDNINE